MTINASGKFVGPLLIVLQETNGVFGPRVQKNIDNLFRPNVEIACSKSGKTSKYLSGLYFKKLKECFQNQKILLLLDSWAGQTDTKFGKEKMGDNVDFLIIPANTTKYLQPLDVCFFHDYKSMVKRIVEFCNTHENLCGNIDLTTRENVIQLHSLVFNQFSSPTFDDMRRYAFQKALIQDSDPVFRTTKQTSFNIRNNTCNKCENVPIIVCSWCWKHLCFTHFFVHRHYHTV